MYFSAPEERPFLKEGILKIISKKRSRAEERRRVRYTGRV
jgi:hypothetical protein